MSGASSAIKNLQRAVKNLQTTVKTEQDIITILSSQDGFKGFSILAELIPIIFYLPADASSEAIMTYYVFVKNSHIVDTGVIDHRFVEADKRFAVIDNKFNILNKKSDKLPIISSVVQGHGNTIDALIDEGKMLRAKIRDLEDRLDFHDIAPFTNNYCY
jgi:hypothetical protein